MTTTSPRPVRYRKPVNLTLEPSTREWAEHRAEELAVSLSSFVDGLIRAEQDRIERRRRARTR